MGGVDIANQYRAAFTTLRPQNTRYWRPLFYCILDIALVNSYLLYKAYHGESRGHRGHWQFQEALAEALMEYSDPPEHDLIFRPTRLYCAYCRQNQLNWKSKHLQVRSFGTNIININRGAQGRVRGSRTQWGCDQCDVPLCKLGDCWRLWHENRRNCN